MTDMHCHILYGLDDGAANPETTLKMLNTAYNDGIDKIICTPHRHFKRGQADPDAIKSRLEEVERMAKENNINIELYTGSEIYYSEDTVSKLKSGEALTLCNTKYVLVEFSEDADYDYIFRAVSKLSNEGFKPIIAHVERISCFLKDYRKVLDISDERAYIQVNADSFTNPAKIKSRCFINTLFKNGAVDFVATDAHNTTTRKAILSRAYKRVAQHFGSEEAERCFVENPEKIIRGERV